MNITPVKNDTSSTDCGPVRDSHVHRDPPVFWSSSLPDASLPETLPYPHQYTLHPGTMDPLSFSNHYSSFSAPWFTHEPVLCSMMPGDLHNPVAGICVPQAMEHQQNQERSEVPSHVTQPMACSVSGGEQVLFVTHCDPGPVFLSLESAPTYGDGGPAPERDASVLGNPYQLPQYHQTACPPHDFGHQAANFQPQAPAARAVGALCELKSRKPCHCTRSMCLKLYCECFASGVMCSDCDCSNCYNNAEHQMKRHEAVKLCLGRNPDAFKPKIAGGKSGEVKGWHKKGCNCKRSSCLKNYCECYEAKIMCTSSCKCIGCRNFDDCCRKDEDESAVQDIGPAAAITPAVVESVCSCLLAQAEKAERENQSPVQAERMVLEEFGHCITKIIKVMFK